MKTRALIALFLAAATTIPAQANTLYKSVDANGVVMFSDVPPPSGARIVEERDLGAPPPAAAYSQPMPGAPNVAAPGGAMANLEQLYTLMDADEELARANARVDQAERNLADARKSVSSRFEGLRLVGTNADRANRERIAFYENDLKVARRELCELLKSRQSTRPAPGSAYVVAVQPISAKVAANKIASRNPS